MSKTLSIYRKKRDFTKTKEPRGKATSTRGQSFVLQKHWARSTHYDLRLQVGNVLKSWAVPKGLPKKIGEKHLAVMTENHPLEYAKFEGEIPEGHYGAGKIKIMDKGTYSLVKDESIQTSLRKGILTFTFHGSKLKGTYALIRFKGKNWLLLKVRKKA